MQEGFIMLFTYYYFFVLPQRKKKIQRYKATKIHTLTPLTYELFSQNSSKMGSFDRVTVPLHILYTANQETEGSQDGILPGWPFGRRAVRQRGYGLRLLILKIANNKVYLGQIRSEEIVYSRFIKIPLG